MIKYRVAMISGEIEKIEVISETKHYVLLFTRDLAVKKITDFYGYFNSFDDAKLYLDECTYNEIEMLNRHICSLRERF